MSENNEPTITVNVDTTEISEKINELKDDETLKRDELLLEIIFRNYDEEVARNELIDNKNSQMIVLTGTMLTLQATLFTNGLLNEFIYSKISINPFNFWIFVLFLASLIMSVVSMISFIYAYKFVGDFKQAPTANYVKNCYDENKSRNGIFKRTFKKLPDIINQNKKLMTRKVNIANKGFKYLIMNILCILSLVILLISCFV